MLQQVEWPSPKLSPSEKRELIYPYYAGFSEDFVRRIFDSFDLRTGARVLDSWSGSGTTGLIASLFGFESVGVDLNPVLSIVADARTARLKHLEVALAVGLRPHTSNRGGGKEQFVFDFLAAEFKKCQVSTEALSQGDRRRVLATILCAMFRTVRHYCRSVRASNPAWYFQVDEACKVNKAELWVSFQQELLFVLHKQVRFALMLDVAPRNVCSDFLDWKAKPAQFDAWITSPPYLTRIDYVKATLPELSLLARIQNVDVPALRTKMLGSPLTKGGERDLLDLSAPSVSDLISKIQDHPSKASDAYYRRFFVSYFNGLHRSFKKASCLLKSGAQGAIVVQSSWYKEIYVDLPLVIMEVASSCGFEMMHVKEFPVKRTIGNVNAHSRSYDRSRPTVESLLTFRKVRE
ncbi:MAG: site-specific DNA-methyltransferase [Bradyrhizobium icense]|nr:MAG: site-specific DNA-methyltransferase [Bradyrhizobium icense]